MWVVKEGFHDRKSALAKDLVSASLSLYHKFIKDLKNLYST